MLSGVEKKDYKYIWLVLIWFILAAGPGIEIANQPAFIGPFPTEYWWLVATWILSIITMVLLCYKTEFLKIEKLEEKVKKLELKKLVKAGEITQEEADERLKAIMSALYKDGGKEENKV